MANAILHGPKIEDVMAGHDQNSTTVVVQQPIATQPPSLISGQGIFCDAALTNKENIQPSPPGIGVIIQLGGNCNYKKLQLSAMSPSVSSSLHDEAYGLLFATMIVDTLHILEPQYYTDYSVLASAVAASSIFKGIGHWDIRHLSKQVLPLSGRDILI